MKQETKDKIRIAARITREKRKFQICKVFELKIDESHLSKFEQNKLKMFFIEAKWLYNHVVSLSNLFEYNYQNDLIQKMDKDGQKEDVTLRFLPKRYRQTIIQIMKQDILSLAKAKKSGVKIGRIKCKSDYTTLELTEHRPPFGTHKITGKNKIKIAGIKRHLTVHGLEQIKPEYEIANAKLIKRPNGYFINLTTYHYPKGEFRNTIKKQAVGIDFGISNNVTTSDSEFFNVSLGETEHLKRLQRRFSKSKKGSSNRNKLKNLMKIEYQKITNKKKDKVNKIVNYLLSNYHQVFIQNDNFRGWKKWFGKQIQHSALGTIKTKLKQSKQVHTIGQFEPTTKMCCQCGVKKEKILLSERVFRCESCGYENDRDVKSAITIMKIGLIQIDADRIKFKSVENSTSGLQNENSETKSNSMKQKALFGNN